MTIAVEYVGYGRPAATALREHIAAAKGDEPLAPVTVVVPSNHVGVATRRLLASGAVGPVCGRGVGVAGVTFLTTYRLAELLGASALAGAGRRPVSTPLIAAALRAALAEDAGVFAPVAAHPATEHALVQAYRELRDLSPKALTTLAASGPRAADVVRLHFAARSRLKADWYDEEDLMAAAIGGSAELGAVVIYLPQQVSRHAAELLSALADANPTVAVVGMTGDERADAEVVVSASRLGVAAGTAAPVPHHPEFVSTSDADEEVRAAVRAIVDAARSGTRLDRIAVLYPHAEPYCRLLHEQLAAADVVVNGPAMVPLTARAAGRTLLGLLSLPVLGLRREDMLDWLAAAPLLDDGRPIPVAAWERASRDAGVVGGRGDWDERLARLAEEMDAAAALAEPDPGGRALRLAEQARRLRTFTLELIDDLGAVAALPRAWPDHAQWARDHLSTLLGGETARRRWPEAEGEAADRVDRALERLAALGQVEGPVDIGVFGRTLELELEADLGRIGRFGEGVFVGPLSMGVGLDLDLVIVVGLAEGVLPGVPHDDSLLPDSERATTSGELVLRGATVDRQHRWLLAAMSGAARQLLVMPRGDLRRSTAHVPSRWVSGITESREVASFDAGLRALDSAATAQEHRLVSLLAGGRADGDPVIARGQTMVEARQGAAFSRFDGNLGHVGVTAPAETSATRLERWVACPYAYFMADVLGIEPVDNPEDELQISHLVRGELVHEVLERFIAEVIARPVPPAPDDPWTAEDRARMREITAAMCDNYERRGLTGRPLFWRRDRARLMAELDRFLDEDNDYRRTTRSRPVATELAFGGRGAALKPVAFPLPDGSFLRVRGKADRIDVTEDGTLRVLDYKTGRADTYANLSEDDPDLGGTKLQLPIYALAARASRRQPSAAVEADYWFVSVRGGWQRLGYPVTDEVLKRFGARLQVIVDGIAAGVFPSHPTGVSTSPWPDCVYCDPDNLGVVDLQRRWERMRTDPALEVFTAVNDG